MNETDSGIEIFAQSVQENIIPLLNSLGFEDEQADSRLFIFSKENLTVKVYFPECHGFDVTITLSPIYTRTHYDKSERSLYWLGRFLGIGEFTLSRRTTTSQIPELTKLNMENLLNTLDSLNLNQHNLWQDLDSFITTAVDED